METDFAHEEHSDTLLSFDTLRRELSDLENGSFVSLTDAELQTKIKMIHTGFVFQAPIFPVGTLIYRAVRVTQRPTQQSRISYPPTGAVTTHGRLNMPGQVIFYGALHQFASCLQECSWKTGEFFAVSASLTTQMMTFNHLGYSSAVLEAFKSKRNLPFFVQMEKDSERNRLIREWQARVFTQQIPAGQEHLYRLSIALKAFALGKMVQTDPKAPDVFSGVIYPSVAMWLLGDNVAILPSEVDSKLALFEVILLTLDSVTELRKDDGSIEMQQRIKTYDFARADGDGNLIWPEKPSCISRWHGCV
jgi:hypothetical protein